MSVTIIKAEDFVHYPPGGRRVATENLSLLQKLPPAFAVSLLREIAEYDWRFPAEQADIDMQLRYLGAMPASRLQSTMAGFAAFSLSPALDKSHMAASPIEFTEKLTAYLWSTHQMDNFRRVAETYQHELRLAEPERQPEISRLCVVVVGKDSPSGQMRLFQKLRPYGTCFTRVNPSGGLDALFGAVNERVRTHPAAYGHWYVDGGAEYKGGASGTTGRELTVVSYAALGTLRTALLEKMTHARTSGVMGPEELRSLLAQLRPEQMGAVGTSEDAVLRHFELNLLTEGSGTQIFSTTFVQWAAREVLRRARPLTLMARFAPRQVQRPMNDMLAGNVSDVKYDLPGSLVDADMGAFYTWINLMRLPGADNSRFVAWFEDRQEALVIAPTMAKGTVSTQVCDLSQVLRWVS
jgi:hypothetical protein